MNPAKTDSNPVWPNFLIIGAAKGGTTALYAYMLQHPEIFLPEIKEPNFFAVVDESLGVSDDDPYYQSSLELFEHVKGNSVADVDGYNALFSPVEQEKAMGEASTFYLYHPRAPERIKQSIPDVKMIAILRNPVERSYSSYLHMARLGRETREFKQALTDERYTSENVWLTRGDYYIRPGFYGKQLQKYYDLFDKKQLQVHLYDDYRKEPQKALSEIFDFLGVDNQFKPDMSARHNVSGIPLDSPLRKDSGGNPVKRMLAKSDAVRKTVKTLLPERWQGKLHKSYQDVRLARPPMDAECRRMLINIFRDDVLALQDLLNRNTTAWLKAK